MPYIILWAALLVLFVVVEASTASLVSIWFVGGSLAALISAVCGAALWLQIVLFFGVSAVLLLCLRPFLKKYVTPHKTPTNVDALIGRQAVVTEQIDNLQGVGAVKLDGAVWSARSEIGVPLPEGETVEIVRISGVKLYVQPAQQCDEKKEDENNG